MSKVPERPTPLIELAHEQDPMRVGLLIRSARSAPDEDTPGVTWRIRNTLARRTERRARILRFAVVGAVIFVAGAVVGAAMHPLFRPQPPQAGPATLAPVKVHEHGARRRVPRPSSAPEPSPVPEAREESVEAAIPRTEEDQTPPALPALPSRSKPKSAPIRLASRQPGAEAVRPPQPVPAPQPVPPPQPPPAAAPAQTAGEQAQISSALGKLRVAHEPAAALALLDEYRSRFPRGVLAAEAMRLRREALLQLGRKAAVLEELEQAPSPDALTSDERVLRGELRAAAGRWQAALADFDAVVRALPTGADIVDRRVRDRLERALWGRASAYGHLGNDDAVCVDLGESLRRFPHGRFAAQAKQLFDKECEP